MPIVGRVFRRGGREARWLAGVPEPRVKEVSFLPSLGHSAFSSRNGERESEKRVRGWCLCCGWGHRWWWWWWWRSPNVATPPEEGGRICIPENCAQVSISLSREVTFGLSRGMSSQQGTIPTPWSVKLAECGQAASALRPLPPTAGSVQLMLTTLISVCSCIQSCLTKLERASIFSCYSLPDELWRLRAGPPTLQTRALPCPAEAPSCDWALRYCLC